MVKCSDCENFEENICKFNMHAFSTIKENVNCIYYKESKIKDKQIKNKVNIFNLSFPIIYYDTDTIITESTPLDLPKTMLKRKYALNNEYGRLGKKKPKNYNHNDLLFLSIRRAYKELEYKYKKACKNNMTLYYRNQSLKSKNKYLLDRNSDLIEEKQLLQKKIINLEKANKFLLETIDNISIIELKNKKENKRLEILLRNTTKAYQIISKEYDNFKKGSGCQKIDKLNRIGFKKEYSCKEFSKIDINFIKTLWCNFCKNKENMRITLINEEKILKLIRKGINSYNLLSLELNFDKKVLDNILFNLMLSSQIWEVIPYHYAIL